MASLVANNDIILHQNLFDIIDMSITDLPGDIGSILGQKRQKNISKKHNQVDCDQHNSIKKPYI